MMRCVPVNSLIVSVVFRHVHDVSLQRILVIDRVLVLYKVDRVMAQRVGCWTLWFDSSEMAV